MANPFEQLVALIWNRIIARRPRQGESGGLFLGFAVSEGRISTKRVYIPHEKRPEHVAGLGRTGTGKTQFQLSLALQDIRAGRPLFAADFHGDIFPALMSVFAAEEARRHTDLSKNLIVIDLTDPEFSVGLNILEGSGEQNLFIRVSEFTKILERHWEQQLAGPRTQEFLRNLLLMAAYNRMTLVDVPTLATNSALRAACVRQVPNAEVRSFFETRYDQLSEAMQNVFREAVLNKLTTFSADPHFRHILGQTRSTFSFVQAMDTDCSILLNAPKGRLGENVPVLASFFLSKLTRDIFSRKKKSLFSLYLDEAQNLAALDTGLDTLLSESRKFGVSAITFNQFLDQYPAQMRSALMAVGTHILFQVSASDADAMSHALDGGKPLAELLRNLPPRQMVVKSGHHRFIHAAVPDVHIPRFDYRNLYNRCRARWARKRTDIEQEILVRQSLSHMGTSQEVLHGWH